MRALLLFNASVDALDKEKLSPRPIAAMMEEVGGEILYALHIMEAKRCSIKKCPQGYFPTGEYNGNPPKNHRF